MNRASKKRGDVDVDSLASATKQNAHDDRNPTLNSRPRPPASTPVQDDHLLSSSLSGSSAFSGSVFTPSSAQDISSPMDLSPPTHTSYLDRPFLMGDSEDLVSPLSSSSSNLTFDFSSPYQQESPMVFGAPPFFSHSPVHQTTVLPVPTEELSANPYNLNISPWWPKGSPAAYASDLAPGTSSALPSILLSRRRAALLDPVPLSENLMLPSKALPASTLPEPSVSEFRQNTLQIWGFKNGGPQSIPPTATDRRMIVSQPVFFQARYKDVINIARRAREEYALRQTRSRAAGEEKTGVLGQDPRRGRQAINRERRDGLIGFSTTDKADKENHPPAYAPPFSTTKDVV
ncbi:hypothetical protein OF83DRAFT_81882 [Amylostereum chailletii]|nr:hypothetical protein OF83DRAFT_81882 [Amylostereum chailletii]